MFRIESEVHFASNCQIVQGPTEQICQQHQGPGISQDRRRQVIGTVLRSGLVPLRDTLLGMEYIKQEGGLHHFL